MIKLNPIKTIVTETNVYPPGVVFDMDEKEAKILIEMDVVTVVTVKDPKKKELKDI
ncbi:MAG: hypothetical protein U1E78_11725 [Gammaproteobacteria bacterium]